MYFENALHSDSSQQEVTCWIFYEAECYRKARPSPMCLREIAAKSLVIGLSCKRQGQDKGV